MPVKKCIYVEVSDETYDRILHAVELSRFDFGDWVIAVCLDAARAEIEAHRKANRAAMEATG